LAPNELLVGGVENVEFILLLPEAVLSLPVLETKGVLRVKLEPSS
jgi:hypothetical protein